MTRMRTFAAIDVGSYEICMKIFELSGKGGMREIDCVRHRIELGTDTYTTGKISFALVDELCIVLKDFTKIMASYQVENYRAYGTSAIRETENTMIVLEQIALRTGLQVEVISNSEQRFLNYKAIASKGERFSQIIEKGTAIADVGGGSVQLSLFDKDSLVATQNIRLGILRIREQLYDMQAKTRHYERLVEELVDNELHVFKKMYLKDREIQNLIVVDDYISHIMKLVGKRRMEQGAETLIDTLSAREYMGFLERLNTHTAEQLSISLGIPSDNASLLVPSAIMIKRILEITGAQLLWAPGVSLCDGIAYDYAEKNKIIKMPHNFDDDIIACARNMNKRFKGSTVRSAMLENLALTMFDGMKKIHGLGKRERLLLRIATLLHDCGKYVSLDSVAESSYNIIMHTEIIGLSHMEREMVANIVMYNTMPFTYYKRLSSISTMDKGAYIVIAKLTAILRAADALNISHKPKFKSMRASLKGDELVLTVETGADMTLEMGLFRKKADFFEEVFSIRPVIKMKKIL